MTTPVNIFRDNFNRTDSQPGITLGNLDSGQVWQYWAGLGNLNPWGIKNNTAFIEERVAGDATIQGTYADLNFSNGSVQVDVGSTLAAGLSFRFTDPANGYCVVSSGFGGWVLFQIIGSAQVVLASTAFVAGTTLKAEFGINPIFPNVISVYVDATLLFTVTNSFNNTGTNHGLSGTFADAFGTRWDNFSGTGNPTGSGIDSFDREDNPSLGISTSGYRWQYLVGGTWKIKDQQAQLFNQQPVVNLAIAFVDFGYSNVIIRARASKPSVGWGLAFRYTASNMGWIFSWDGTQFILTAAGAFTPIVGTFTAGLNIDDVFTITLQNNHILIQQNTTLIFNVFHTHNINGTKHGIIGDNNSAADGGGDGRWEDFSIDFTPAVLPIPQPPKNAFVVRGRSFSTLKWDRVIKDISDNYISPTSYSVYKTLNSNSTGFEILGEVTTTEGMGSFWSKPGPSYIIDSTRDLQFRSLTNTTGENIVDQACEFDGTSSISFTSSDLTSTFFLTEDLGFIAGDTGLLARTADGGSTWSILNSTTAVNLRSIFFVTPSIGWAVGDAGTILYTTNGGLDWSTQVSGTGVTLYSVFFLTSSEGWIVGGTGTILHTTNGGSSWSTQTSGTIQTLNSVIFRNSSSGVLGLIVGNTGTVLKTLNSGTTWTAQVSGTTNNLFSVSFDKVSTQTAVVYACGAVGTILKSSTEGTDWQILPPPTGVTSDLTGLSFSTTQLGWIVGKGPSVVLNTTNGLTFTTETISSKTTTNLNSTFFVDGLHGYITGDLGLVLTTNNGGQNWFGIGGSDFEPTLQALTSSGDTLAQTFTPQSENISGFVFTLDQNGTTFTTSLTVTLGLGGNPNTMSVLGTVTVPLTLDPPSPQYVTVLFNSSIPVEKGKVHSVTITKGLGVGTVNARLIPDCYAGDRTVKFIDVNDIDTPFDFFYKIQTKNLAGMVSEFTPEIFSTHIENLTDNLPLTINNSTVSHEFFDYSSFDEGSFS